MLFHNFLTVLPLIMTVLAVAIPDTKSVDSAPAFADIIDNPIWANIRKISADTPSKSDKWAAIEKLVKGTFLDPEVIAASQAARTSTSDDPIAQSVQCDTTGGSPNYYESITLVSEVYGRRDETHGRVYNPGRGCSEHASLGSSHFGVCSWNDSVMSWKTFGDFSYAVTTRCIGYYNGTPLSGGRYEWDTSNPRFHDDVRVY
ncbi:hypothetical protein L873DRAFT_1812154 [Choiromyces venosus 120613-1]|uniref:Uncharacterized protein n=1 Tax=Choiromyces venosus 120613-1 TaxID=1336337 RepID=A0A3N4JC50_9PEZI|nr:hypothetical protein L873DRAFT_1812154 [Choiromyces venosus 120613-1]